MRRILSSIMLLTMAASSFAAEIDTKPLPGVKVERAFKNFKLDRPIVLTDAGDGSSDLYIASQLGKIFVLPNKQDATEDDLKVFLDWEEKTSYKEKENEEGMLGMAFHPNYKKTGEVFFHYTSKDLAPHTNVIARFTRSKADPAKLDPASHEVLLTITHPYWNHKGGGLAFGPDGYLYISVGDGGFKDDPHNNGQNVNSLLGKILRIDVDNKAEGKNYSIPKDNPFAGKKDAKPEIFAYGFRNVWGMSFDPATKAFWAADVGQDLWEEIDLVVKGGNYGWKLREGKHKFQNGSDPKPELIEPIFEYHHEIGKSITGGLVYHGKNAPVLKGSYLYGDYVTNRVWALKYDEKTKTVTGNHLLSDNKMLPVISFGKDHNNEVYATDAFDNIWWFKSE